MYATAIVIWPELDGRRAEGGDAASLFSSWSFGLLTFPTGAHLLTLIALLSALGFRKVTPGIVRDLTIPFAAFTALAMSVGWLSTDILPWLALGVVLMAVLLRGPPSLACFPHEPNPAARVHRMVLGAGLMGTLAAPLLVACRTLVATLTDPRAYAKYWIGETIVTYLWGGSLLLAAAMVGALVGAA